MKRLLRKIANNLGYDFIKINVHSQDKAKKVFKVKVGKFIINMPGNNIQISNYKYEPEVNSQLGRLAEIVNKKYSQLEVIDIGANVGDTIAIIKSYIDIPIIGIEGDEICYRFLKENTNQFNNITIIKQFLGEKKQSINVAFEKNGWNTTIIPSDNSKDLITLQTLDEVLHSNKLFSNNLKLLKIDTEGFDTIILRGATDLIKEQKPVIYFEYNRSNMDAINENGLATLFSLVNYGYKNVVLFDNKGRYITKIDLLNHNLITELHNYSNENNSAIAYYDMCLFHENDIELEKIFIDLEKNY
jgi:FkbM family methyltransferase